MEILILAVIIGCLPGAIAQAKGHSFVAWWLFGAALFVVALPASFMLPPARREPPMRCHIDDDEDDEATERGAP